MDVRGIGGTWIIRNLLSKSTQKHGDHAVFLFYNDIGHIGIPPICRLNCGVPFLAFALYIYATRKHMMNGTHHVFFIFIKQNHAIKRGFVFHGNIRKVAILGLYECGQILSQCFKFIHPAPDFNFPQPLTVSTMVYTSPRLTVPLILCCVPAPAL